MYILLKSMQYYKNNILSLNCINCILHFILILIVFLC
uniref:Uncharacterized protein n=1 Tax=Polysiphonia elongata TaxID=159753 RepID=A0A1Z1MBV0_9FLOR|nr:hypothetical protein [Polysiphonia elongata]ARW63271.1 hypothetical protein [Polysiphonia elongata]